MAYYKKKDDKENEKACEVSSLMKPSSICSSVSLSQLLKFSGVPRTFFRGGGGLKKFQLRTEGRKNGDLGTVAR
jgi:hypothetical protein